MWPLLSGANTTNPRTMLLIGSPADTLGTGGTQQGTVVQGLISPPYKLLLGSLANAVWTGPVFPNGTDPYVNVTEDCGDPDGVLSKDGTGCLYDLESDPSERQNLAAANPDLVQSLRRIIAQAQASVFQPQRGTLNTTGMCAAALTTYRGFLGPFM
jgi:hypothetical protein